MKMNQLVKNKEFSKTKILCAALNCMTSLACFTLNIRNLHVKKI